MPGGDPATTVSSPRPSIGPVMPNHKKKTIYRKKYRDNDPHMQHILRVFWQVRVVLFAFRPMVLHHTHALPCLSYLMQASSVSPARVKCKGIKVKIGRVRDTREKSFPLPIGVSSFRPRPGCKCMLCVCVCAR